MADESFTPNADSRQYRFAYEIHSRSDVPSDFAATLLSDHWQAALFMPGDTEAFWQPPEYPPRIYLLKQNRLLIYSHPAWGEELFEAQLDHLLAIELQKSLLYGVVAFHSTFSSAQFRYSTVHQELLNSFLQHLRSHWLIPVDMNLPITTIEEGIISPSARCIHELERELDGDEPVYRMFSQPAIHSKQRRRFFSRSVTSPALLIALTDRRIISISTGIHDRDDPYEIAIRYFSRLAFFKISTTHKSGGAGFELCIGDQVIWKYAVSDDALGPFSSLFSTDQGTPHQMQI